MDYLDLLRAAGVSKRTIRDLRSLSIPVKEEHINRSLYFYGEPGTGKTTTAAAILSTVLRRSVNVEHYLSKMDPASDEFDVYFKANFNMLFVKVPVLLQEIKATFNRDYIGPSESEIINHCLSTRLLVLDDIGVEMTTDWAYQTLYLIVDTRYSELRNTIFISNLAPDELDKKMGDSRLISRIIGMCGTKGILRMNGKDRRIE